jgi:hypothetical protein
MLPGLLVRNILVHELIQFFRLLFVSAAKIKIMSQENRNKELYTHDVIVKVESKHEGDDCVHEQVPSLKTNKIFCVPEGCTVEDVCFINNPGDNEQNVEKRLSTAKSLSVISSPILIGEKKLEPKKEMSEVGMHVARKEVLPGSSKLNFRPLQLESNLVIKEGKVSNIEATKTATPAETLQPEDIKSNSTITILRPYKPSEDMTPVETLQLLKNVISSHKSVGKAPVIRVVTGPRGKVPISRLRSSLSSKGHVQLLCTPSQCQELLLSLAGSGRLKTLMQTVQENKQIPSIGGTKANENTVSDTVRKLTPDVPTTSSEKVQKVANSSAGEIQGTLVSAGRLAVSQGEPQSVNPGHMKVTVHTSDPHVNPVPGSSFGQLPGVLSSPATGDFQPLQIPLSSSPFGQIHTPQVPNVAGAPHSYLPVLLPPPDAVLPSVAGSGQMFQFQHVVTSSSGGQLNMVPSAGAPVQLHAVIAPTGNFIFVSRDTGHQLNFTSSQGNQF